MKGKHNALAELAEWLEEQVDSFPVLANQFAWQDTRDVSNIKKIRRILAELAKVSEGSWVEDLGGKFYLCRLKGRVVETAVGKCRAIAEEK